MADAPQKLDLYTFMHCMRVFSGWYFNNDVELFASRCISSQVFGQTQFKTVEEMQHVLRLRTKCLVHPDITPEVVFENQ